MLLVNLLIAKTDVGEEINQTENSMHNKSPNYNIFLKNFTLELVILLLITIHIMYFHVSFERIAISIFLESLYGMYVVTTTIEVSENICKETRKILFTSIRCNFTLIDFFIYQFTMASIPKRLAHKTSNL